MSMITPECEEDAHVSMFIGSALLVLVDFGAFLLVWFWKPFPLLVVALAKVAWAHRYHYAVHRPYTRLFNRVWPSVSLYCLAALCVLSAFASYLASVLIDPDYYTVEDTSVLLSLFLANLFLSLLFLAVHFSVWFIFTPTPHS
eukprot:TRINITY_DN14302_c0_g1_i1.p1 TRINITY_DN14302_c0_g1~~TRINITY_DN14302_c0_g1_i1.p1  ORF type:complete len:143 (-),score=49.58 TRINITY_DN14302_c0_g1_i1:22-450(-)